VIAPLARERVIEVASRQQRIRSQHVDGLHQNDIKLFAELSGRRPRGDGPDSADAQLIERAFGSKLNAVPGDQEPATESTVLNSTRSDAAGMSATAI
jgi:hypothetical protein